MGIKEILFQPKISHKDIDRVNLGELRFQGNTYKIKKAQIVDLNFLNRLKSEADRDFYKEYEGKLISLGIENENDFIKIEFLENRLKKNSLEKEYEIIKHLNKHKCVSVPDLNEFGEFDLENIQIESEIFSESLIYTLKRKPFYLSLQKLSHSTKGYFISDLLIAIIEQGKSGVIQNDFKKENIFFIDDTFIKIIDYDQAEIDLNFKKLNSKEIVDKSIEMDLKSYKVHSKGWLRHFSFINYKLHIKKLFDEKGRFNLLKTSLYQNQFSTNTKNMSYHTYHGDNLFVKGIRDLGQREKILSSIEFKKDESVLDIGSNIGLVTQYIKNRGCDASGYEIDFKAHICSRFISNIDSFDIDFVCIDLDSTPKLKSFDTILLFSVIHHTKNLKGNCIKISNSCKRIIVECRLKEDGKKPIKAKNSMIWTPTSSWNFSNTNELYSYLEGLFPNHDFYKNHGKCDKSRYILELRKKED